MAADLKLIQSRE